MRQACVGFMRHTGAVAAVVLLLLVPASQVQGQDTRVVSNGGTASGSQVAGAPRGASTTDGFFVGAGLEGNGLLATDGGINSTTESGRGGGLVLGYGFTPRVSLYAAFSAAQMESVDFVGNYGLGHFDLGARIHFRAGEGRVVPFVQAGLAGRAISATLYSSGRAYDVSASGAGVAFGGGLNAHFNPSLAFSGHVTWMAGNFSRYEVNGVQVSGDGTSATSARVHLGLVWFPRGGSRRP